MYSLFAPGERRRIVAYLDGLYPDGHASQQAKINVLRVRWSSRASALLARIETQSAGVEELRSLFGPLRALMPSILDKAFKGEL